MSTRRRYDGPFSTANAAIWNTESKAPIAQLVRLIDMASREMVVSTGLKSSYNRTATTR